MRYQNSLRSNIKWKDEDKEQNCVFILFGFLVALVILSVERTLRTENIEERERLSEMYARASDTDPGKSKENFRKAKQKASEEMKKNKFHVHQCQAQI